MSTAKVTISLDSKVLRKVDRLVRSKTFPSRSRAVQAAIEEKLERMNRTRLAIECEKLDVAAEQKMADEGLTTDVVSWPEY